MSKRLQVRRTFSHSPRTLMLLHRISRYAALALPQFACLMLVSLLLAAFALEGAVV